MSDPASEKFLIINAGDYGYTAGVSAGIRLAHRQGIVSSTSVMTTMPAAVSELTRLRSETPMLGVGVHLSVTEGCPFRLPRFWAPGQLARALPRSPPQSCGPNGKRKSMPCWRFVIQGALTGESLPVEKFEVENADHNANGGRNSGPVGCPLPLPNPGPSAGGFQSSSRFDAYRGPQSALLLFLGHGGLFVSTPAGRRSCSCARMRPTGRGARRCGRRE